MGGWFLAALKRPIALALASFIALSVASCATSKPRNDRAWYPYLQHTTDAEITADGFSVSPVLDWSYDRSGATAETYTTADYKFSDLREVWFVLEPQPGSTIAAHTFLLFEFTGDRLLGVTIEARRETGEDYSAVRGLFNTFELSYIWGTAHDLLTRRAVMLDHDVFMYPLALKEEWKRDVLTRLLQRTEALETIPRYYNTLTSNCTNEIAKATDIPWDKAFILTGLSDEFLYDKKLIPGASFDAAHADSAIAPFVKTLNETTPKADFDKALLTELRRRAAI